MGERVKVVAIGQVLSLCITGASFASSVLVRQDINTPASQTFLSYLLLASTNGFFLLRRRKPLKLRWYLYLIFAIMDMEANYLATKSFQYTSITSVMLLDCWSIPCVLLLTWLLLNTPYLRGHLIGVFLCIVGLVLVLLSDVHSGDRSGGSNVILGDTLVFIAATLYACCNVYEEVLIKHVDRIELLTMIGSFGAVLSGCQVILLERHELVAIKWTASAVLAFAAFAISISGFGALVPQLLQIGGSTMLNLSLLTSDMYAIAIRLALFHQSVDWLYFVAFVTVTVGIIWYSMSGEPSAHQGVSSVGMKEVVYKLVNSSSTLDSTPTDGDSMEPPQSPRVPTLGVVLSQDDESRPTAVQEPV